MISSPAIVARRCCCSSPRAWRRRCSLSAAAAARARLGAGARAARSSPRLPPATISCCSARTTQRFYYGERVDRQGPDRRRARADQRRADRRVRVARHADAAPARQATSFEDRPEGIARDRWDVAIETVDRDGARRVRRDSRAGVAGAGAGGVRRGQDARSSVGTQRRTDRAQAHHSVSGDARPMIDDARQHEEQIGQPIDVPNRARHRPAARAPHPAFGAAADGPRDVQRRAGRRAAGENELRAAAAARLRADRSAASSRVDVGVAERPLSSTRGAILSRRIGELRAEGEQIALDLHERVVEVRIEPRDARAKPSQAFSSSTSPYASTRGSCLADARAVEERRLAGIAGARVDFHVGGLYEMPQAYAEAARQLPAAGAARSPALPPAAADLVSPARPRSAVAQDRRSVPHPRVRDHAAADAGRSRAAEVRANGSRSIRRSRRWRPRPSRTSPTRGIRSATTSGRGGCRRSRAKRSRATAASCRPTRRRCCRSRASARTRPARFAASRSASAPRFSTPTSRACCSACSSARAIRRATR